MLEKTPPGVPCAKIIERDEHAQVPQRMNGENGGIKILMRYRFADLQPEQRRAKACFFERGSHIAWQVRIAYLGGREIDRHDNLPLAGMGILPLTALAAGHQQYPPPDVAHESKLLGHGKKRPRLKQSAFRVLPAQQGLNFVGVARRQIDDGLIEKPQ